MGVGVCRMEAGPQFVVSVYICICVCVCIYVDIMVGMLKRGGDRVRDNQ